MLENSILNNCFIRAFLKCNCNFIFNTHPVDRIKNSRRSCTIYPLITNVFLIG